MRVAFTGSRTWTDEARVRVVLEELVKEHGRGNLEICHGKSSGGGADALVERIADELRIAQTPFPVRRDLDGNQRWAPLNRNTRMLKSFMPHLLIAFRAEGKSNGTDYTIKEAEELKIPVRKIEE